MIKISCNKYNTFEIFEEIGFNRKLFDSTFLKLLFLFNYCTDNQQIAYETSLTMWISGKRKHIDVFELVEILLKHDMIKILLDDIELKF